MHSLRNTVHFPSTNPAALPCLNSDIYMMATGVGYQFGSPIQGKLPKRFSSFKSTVNPSYKRNTSSLSEFPPGLHSALAGYFLFCMSKLIPTLNADWLTHFRKGFYLQACQFQYQYATHRCTAGVKTSPSLRKNFFLTNYIIAERGSVLP